MFMGISFFSLGKFSFIIFWRCLLALWVGYIHLLLYWLFSGWVFSLLPGFLECFEIGAFCFLWFFFFFLTIVSMSGIVYYAKEILSFVSCILLMMLNSVTPILFPRFFHLQGCPFQFCKNYSTFIFRPSVVLFNFFSWLHSPVFL